MCIENGQLCSRKLLCALIVLMESEYSKYILQVAFYSTQKTQMDENEQY